jgi:hypothetical protein
MSEIPVHAHDDDLALYLQGRLQPERLSAIEPHLFACDTCRERLSRCFGSRLILHLIGRAKTDEGRERSEPRFTTGSGAMLQELSPLSFDRQKVQIVDISKNGLGIVAPKAIFPGTIVQIRINTTVELGEVRYSLARDDDNGYRIGLRFIAVSEGNGEHVALHPTEMAADLPVPLEQQPDRRLSPREQLSQPAFVNLLGTCRLLHGEVRNLSKGGTQIWLAEPLPVSSLVKIEYADKLLQGEVVYCRREQDGWLLGIRVAHALSGVRNLDDAKRRSR